MKLVLDFGNSLQKCALFDRELVAISTYENITLDDIIAFTEDKNVESAILSSVINYDSAIEEWLSEKFFFIQLTENTPIPIINKYGTPKTLGKDRLAAAIGGATLFPKQNMLSVDCGTAIKFDMVTSDGEYLGGSIAPGLWLRFKALHNFTDKLPLVSYKNQPDLIGVDTLTSIQSGVMNGCLAEINGLIERYKSNFRKLNVVLTGGEMIYFEKSIKSSIFAEPNLVMIGLYQILVFNENSKLL